MDQIDRVIVQLKTDINERKNKKLTIKLRTFLKRLGYKRRNELLVNNVNQSLKQHRVCMLLKNKPIDWAKLDIDERVTFEISADKSKRAKNAVQGQHAGTIKVSQKQNPLDLYLHQTEALQVMDQKLNNGSDRFAGILVIPTGGGKTLTAVQWVLRNIINQNKKVVWLAHRHELLEQALSAVKGNAYANLVSKRENFTYRVISGQHDRAVHINKDDDFLIASKDSLNRGMESFVTNWLQHHDEVFLVIDEAHHATAKTYRRIINVLNEKAKQLQVLGLTATPFRTAEAEQGLLKKLFKDDIVYKVDLKTLISRGILSEPVFKELQTAINMKEKVSEQDMKSIRAFDSIPESIARHIAENKWRNKQIVQEYINNKAEYGKLLLFAINKVHAVELNKLFRDQGIASEYVIAAEKQQSTGIEANKDRIQRFRNNEVDVLINVNILTEGTDLPDVQTVFLTRPTVSSILMTQMIGRALRGKKAGGTKQAYIVSFIDEWKDKLTWVNPEKLYIEETSPWEESETERAKKLAKLISIQKIEEFVNIADDSIDTNELESIEFMKTIPLGIYSFSLLIPNEKGEDFIKNCEVLVYDSTEQAYQKFIEELPALFRENGVTDKEYLEESQLELLARKAEDVYFRGLQTVPAYHEEDIKDILSYYALKGVAPSFLHFENREKFNISTVASYIYEEELGGRKKKAYIDALWNQENNFFKVYFGNNKLYFRKALDNELLKLEEPEIYAEVVSGV